MGVYIYQINMVVDVKERMVNSSATKHICVNKYAFTSCLSIRVEENLVYFGDSRNAKVLGKDKVLLKLISQKILTFNNVLHLPNFRVNLILVLWLGKVRVKVLFKFDKIVITKNNVFMDKGYCNQG